MPVSHDSRATGRVVFRVHASSGDTKFAGIVSATTHAEKVAWLALAESASVVDADLAWFKTKTAAHLPSPDSVFRCLAFMKCVTGRCTRRSEQPHDEIGASDWWTSLIFFCLTKNATVSSPRSLAVSSPHSLAARTVSSPHSLAAR